MHTILASAWAHGAVTGFVTAASVDLHAFLSWKDPADAKSWQWRTALLRWGQGIVAGALTGAGYGALIG